MRRFIDAIARLPQSRRFSLHEPPAAGAYDAIVVESDEVWNFRHPWYGSEPIFFGDGLKAGRLVSYAASFGNHSAWDGIAPNWAEKLLHFSELSVRDENSWHLVRGSTGREADVVLDPCLAFPEPAKKAVQSNDRYAVVYGHGFPGWFAERIRSWAEGAGVRLISIGYSNGWADEQRIGAGPTEFAELVAGARAVITNFFHGCVFALLNGKPWATVPSDYRAIKIPDLGTMIGAQDRLVDEHDPDKRLSDLLGIPVSPRVEERVEELRARSEAYLDAALV